MMEFVEPDPAAGRRHRHQVGGEATVVGLGEKPVAEDEGISERHQLSLADGLAYTQNVTPIVAKQRNLRRRRLEGASAGGAGDGLDPAKDGGGGMSFRG